MIDLLNNWLNVHTTIQSILILTPPAIIGTWIAIAAYDDWDYLEHNGDC